ncbi:MAG: gamma-glutamylcyclotransferase [Alphaproteobacteria bacterium]
MTSLTRESIRDGVIQRTLEESGVTLLTESELAAVRGRVFAQHPAGTDMWVFGYGSLIWNPAFHYVERRMGVIRGYHRRFCLWTHLGRGSPENPGLTLGLETGGVCRGVAYRIAAECVHEEITILFRREMLTGAYVPTWVDVATVEGKVRGLTFVINKRFERYAGRLTEAQIVQSIATATGRFGPCSDYLFNTVQHLEELGIVDRNMERLKRKVEERCREISGHAP